MHLSRRVAFLFLWLLFLQCTGLAADWKKAVEYQGTAYFFVSIPNRVERYDLTSRTWLSVINLPGGYGGLTTGTVDADGLYVAYDKAVYRYALNGSTERHVLNTADSVRELHTDGNLLLINHTVSSYARLKSIDKTTNTVIASFENYIDSVAGSSISRTGNKIFGRSEGGSPSDITYVTYTDAGKFTAGGDSPHHGDYPTASRTWVFPDEGRVVDNSGTVYSASSLTYLSSFGGRVDDIIFYGGNIPIVLRGSELVAYTASLLPTGSRQLTGTPKTIFLSGDQVVAFASNDATTNGIGATLVPLSTLNPPTPGQAVDPRGAKFTPDATFIDKNGILNLFSKAHQSIFRWNPTTQDYLPTIPLVGVPEFVAYSEVNQKVYLAYSSGLIRSMNLNDPTFDQPPFASLPSAPLGLATADSFVFAVDGSGAWDTHYSFSPAGTLVDSVDWNYFSTEYIWSKVRQKMYFFRDDTSPNDLLSEEINANGTAYPSMAMGALGVYKDSPLHDSAGFSHPIRIAPDGSMIVLGSGVMHDPVSLARLSTALPNTVSDIAWLNGGLFTTRSIAGSAQFQQWTSPTFGLARTLQVPGIAHALLSVDNSRMVGITLGSDGTPSFYVLNASVDVVAPPSLAQVTGLAASVASATRVNLTWNDVSGESSYRVERKLGVNGAWGEVGSTTISLASYADATVSSGNTYYFRVSARNGTQAGAVSAELEVKVTAPAAPTGFSASALSASEIQIAWSDVEAEVGYLLERRTTSRGIWNQIATPAANVVSYRDQYLSSNTTYEYRLQSQNGVGQSAYSLIVSAKTNALPPAVPYLHAPTAPSASLVTLSWYSSSYPDQYTIFRRLPGATLWTVVASVDGMTTDYSDSSVAPNTTYEYSVSATNSAGTSANSSVQTIRTPKLPAPTAATNLAAHTVSRMAVAITWTDSTYETQYRMERRLGEGAWQSLALLTSNTVSYQDTTVAQGGIYSYRVAAINLHGETLSNEDSAVAQDIVVLVDDDFDPAPTAIWNPFSGGSAVGGAVGFRIGNAIWFNGSAVRSMTTVPVDVSNGATLRFQFRAGNESVEGSTHWNNSESDERVFVEYSTDGVNWSLLKLLETVYPNASSWTKSQLELPAAACTPSTRLRWRQEAHSGPGFDQWAVDDLEVAGGMPQPPAAPAFINASANSSRAVAVLWSAVNGATGYTIERAVQGSVWQAIGSVVGSQTYYTDTTVKPSSLYYYRVVASNAGGTSTPSSQTIVVTWSVMAEWRFGKFGTIENSGSAASLAENGNGVSNLLEFAFNMEPLASGIQLAKGTGLQGLPAIYLHPPTMRLRLEMVRRKANTSPGITYAVEFSGDCRTWVTSSAIVSITNIDADWERVVYEDVPPVNGVNKPRFARARIVE